MIKAATYLVTGLLAGVFLALPAAEPAPEKRYLWADVGPETPTNVRVLGQNRKPAEYGQIRQHEIELWRGELALRYRKNFRVAWSRFYETAWNCPDATMAWLDAMTRTFIKNIYPRYFRSEPEKPWRIVCFATKEEFTRTMGTGVYGFYRPAERTIYTYATSGHGTLWHELVHAFIDQNASRPPPQWFGEGLASFYEMAWPDRSGGILEGFANWRHPALVRAIRAGKLEPLAHFLGTRTMADPHGYARARFLFCYLWHRQAIVPFVTWFLEVLSPTVPESETGRQVVAWLERRFRMSIQNIEAGMHALALATRQDEKLRQDAAP